MKKSGKTSKKSDSAAGTAAASSRSTSSSSKSIVSPRITTSTVSQTLTSQSGISQSSNTPVHRSVSGGVVAEVTEFSSSLRLRSSAPFPVGLFQRNVSLPLVVRVPFEAPVALSVPPLGVDLPVPTPRVPVLSLPPPPPSAPGSL